MEIIKKLIYGLGGLLGVGCGGSTFVLWVMSMYAWMGLFGGFVAVMLLPGIFMVPVIYPIVEWSVTGVFPGFHFMIAGVGIVGWAICITCKSAWDIDD
jgi:hypothetical protein